MTGSDGIENHRGHCPLSDPVQMRGCGQRARSKLLEVRRETGRGRALRYHQLQPRANHIVPHSVFSVAAKPARQSTVLTHTMIGNPSLAENPKGVPDHSRILYILEALQDVQGMRVACSRGATGPQALGQRRCKVVRDPIPSQ